ncbi:hypothetical protein LB505_005026 [Fusarium chuoi]|nr:hypothetical protein LB505_005026 [Fusarium chuoi]
MSRCLCNSRHSCLGLRLARLLTRLLPLASPGTGIFMPIPVFWQRTVLHSSSHPTISSSLPITTWSSLFTCPPTSMILKSLQMTPRPTNVAAVWSEDRDLSQLFPPI